MSLNGMFVIVMIFNTFESQSYLVEVLLLVGLPGCSVSNSGAS